MSFTDDVTDRGDVKREGEIRDVRTAHPVRRYESRSFEPDGGPPDGLGRPESLAEHRRNLPVGA